MDGVSFRDGRVPLREVVMDCTRRWFKDTLREARAGDTAMQVLVAQMYQSGYGVSKSEHNASKWISKASRCRTTPSSEVDGYNGSESDSDEEKIGSNS